MTVQRVRIFFAKRERVRYISHLDVLRYWERAIRRAGLPLSYSQGFTAHPKLQFAGPLPLGYLAEREVVDVSLDERVPLSEIAGRLAFGGFGEGDGLLEGPGVEAGLGGGAAFPLLERAGVIGLGEGRGGEQ